MQRVCDLEMLWTQQFNNLSMTEPEIIKTISWWHEMIYEADKEILMISKRECSLMGPGV